MSMRLTQSLTPQNSADGTSSSPGLHHLRVVTAQDADEHADNLTDWQQHYDQVSSGEFKGSLVERHLGGMQVFREHTSQAVRQSCNVWPDAIWFGLPLRARADTRINGRLSADHTLLVRPGNREFELMTPSAFDIYGMVIPQQQLLTFAEQLGCEIDWRAVCEAELLRVDAQAYAQCSDALRQVLSTDTELAGDPNRQLQQGALMSFLLNLLDKSEVERQASRSLARRRQVVAAARDLVQAQPDTLLTVPELCSRLGVSRRTLQYCFEEIAGMSPLHYLRAIRLNGVRRQLREERHASVADVATNWGFSHLSQFAADYRKLFGVCPSKSRT